MDVTELITKITAVGAIGTAATGLVDTTKIFAGGVSRVGYDTIKRQIAPFAALLEIPGNAAYETIYGLWINGAAIDDQKAKVKALIKLGFNPDTVEEMAAATGLPEAALQPLAQNIADGTDLTAPQVNIYGRLDAILSAVIDGAYERADQHYRNAAKALAAVIAIGLALIGGYAVGARWGGLWEYVLIGAVAVPVAPVAKDLTTAINTAVQSSKQLRGLLK